MAQRHRISRRAVLRGAGVCMALPFLEAMGSPGPRVHPRRLAVFTVPFGVVEKDFHPPETGFEYSMTPTLKPLERFRRQFSIFSGHDHDVRGGHAAAHAVLSGILITQRAAYPDGNVTVDQRAAEFVGHETRFSSLNFWKEGMSYTRSGVRVPAISKPSDAFALLFVDRTDDEKKFDRAAFATSGSILDAVREDAKSFQRSLGHSDREKLEEYFSSVRQTEKKLQVSAGWLDKPKPKTQDPSMKGVREGTRDNKIGGNLVESWFDLMFLALQTDSTRVVATAASNCNWGLEGVNQSYHTLSHHGMRPEVLKELSIVETFLMKQLSRFLGRLESTKEADGGTMLDTTQVLFGSGLGSGSRHSNINLPIILAGGGFRHGQHFDGRRGTPLCNLYLTILQRMGCRIDRFNTSSGSFKGLDVAR